MDEDRGSCDDRAMREAGGDGLDAGGVGGDVMAAGVVASFTNGWRARGLAGRANGQVWGNGGPESWPMQVRRLGAGCGVSEFDLEGWLTAGWPAGCSEAG